MRQKGDHRVYSKDGLKSPVIIPTCELQVFIIQTNLKTLNISREEYFKLLKDI